MNPLNDERFLHLAMKAAAGSSSDAERAELDALVAQKPELKAELARLKAEAELVRETLPLVAATEATAGEFPAYARGRLQSKVRETYGRAGIKEAPAARPNWLWLRGVAFATAAAAVAALLVVPALLQPGRPVIELALLDTAGQTRAGSDEETRLLQANWKEAKLQTFAQRREADAWSQTWPSSGRGRVVKIIYDRPAAEVHVLGRWDGREIQQTFVVEKDLGSTLRQAREFVEKSFK